MSRTNIGSFSTINREEGGHHRRLVRIKR
jgi:hypothetical protein